MPSAVLLMRTRRFRAISKMSVFSEDREVTSGRQGGQVVNACGWEGKLLEGRSAACDVIPEAWRINIGSHT